MSAGAGVAGVWNRFLFGGYSAASLASVRIALGSGLLAFHVLQFATVVGLDNSGAHFYFTRPMWILQILGIERLDPLLFDLGFAVLMVSTLMFALGCFTRSSLLTMIVCIFLLKATRDSIAGDYHHRYVIPINILFILLLSRCGDAFSIDAWRRRAQGVRESIPEWQASWPIRAAQLYICSFYFWSGLAKLRVSGLSWLEPDFLQRILLLRSVRYGFEDGVAAGSGLAYSMSHSAALAQGLAMLTYVFELGFPLILLVRSTRLRLAFLAAVTGFHVANYVLISVKFLFLPIVFVVFFDLSKPLEEFIRRRRRVDVARATRG